MPTVEQIRSARAYLGWSQKDLADHAGMSQTGLARIENGSNKANSQTLAKISRAFDDADIEFIGDSGLRKRSGEIKVFRDGDGARAFMDDVYQTARDIGGNICLFNGVPARLQQWLGEEWYAAHAERMYALKDKIDFKVIVKEGEKLFIGKKFAEYRYFPKELFHDRMVYMYGSKLAFLTLTDDDARIVVIEQSEIAQSFRVLFDISWNQVATAPSTSQEVSA